MKSTQIIAIAAAIVVVLAGVGIYLMGDNDEVDLKVSYLKKQGYETQMVADAKGFFDAEGIVVESIPVTGSGQDAVNMLLTGNVDIAATGEGPAATTMNAQGGDFVVVCGVNRSTGGQVWVTGNHMTGSKSITPYDATANSDNGNAAAVKASFENAKTGLGTQIKIGVQQGSTTEGELKAWLRNMEISFADFTVDDGSKTVKLIHITANSLYDALASHSIDIMAASQPWPSNALNRISSAYQVGSNSDIGSYGVSMYITLKSVWEQKHDSIMKFVKALDDATDYMVAHEDECVDICTEHIGTNEATVQAGFDIADWRVDWTDDMADTMQKTCVKRGFTTITLQQCKDACPSDLKTLMAELNA